MAPSLAAARTAGKTARTLAGRRYLSDVTITRTGKPIIRVEGGR
jgi:NADH dehydrogenase (ubiquinone) 1 alpha subcomplex subunit 9